MKADAIGRIVAAAQTKKDIATLYGGKHFRVAKLCVERAISNLGNSLSSFILSL